MSADLFEAFSGESQPHSGANGNPWATASQPRSQPHQRATDDVFLNNQRHTSDSAKSKREEPLWQSGSNGNDVLFDAEGEVADDDFGDFADVEQQTSSTIRAAQSQRIATHEHTSTPPSVREDTLIDLLSLEDDPPATPPPKVVSGAASMHKAATTSELLTRTDQVITSDPFEDDGWGDFEAIAPRQQPAEPQHYSATSPSLQTKSIRREAPTLDRKQPPPLPLGLKPEPEDDWEVFEDGQPDPYPTRTTAPPVPAPSKPSRPSHPSKPSHPSAAPHPPRERPTNIPLPAILLSLLPTHFQSLLASILESPSPALFAPEILAAHRTTSRLIAGRTLRWKRDTLLAQSTRIAAAGKPGGMKLASVNKLENAKEEREVGEAVEGWNRNVRHWQGTLTKVKMSGGGAGGGLKLSSSMSVKAMSGRAGVMEAKVLCALCGLKRSERVNGMDDENGVGVVEDVFGEFWTEGWGHKECVEWWERWKGELGQR